LIEDAAGPKLQGCLELRREQDMQITVWILLPATSAAASTAAATAKSTAAAAKSTATAAEPAPVRKATSVRKPAISAESAAVGAALAEVPASTLVTQTAISLAETIALPEAIAGALSYITRPETTGASSTEIASSQIALPEAIAGALSYVTRPEATGASSTETAAKAGIMYPPVPAADTGAVEIISVDEVVVYGDIVISPSSVPSPVIPASAPDRSEGKPSSPGDEAQPRRIIHRGIRISGRSPHRFGIVLRHVDHFRRRWLNNDVILTVAGGRGDCLLRRRLECAILLRLLAHPLDRLHDTFLLRQDRISEIGRPTDILTQALEHVRDHYQRLDACIPRLFRSRVRERLTSE
jgi:hypothetical protein